MNCWKCGQALTDGSTVCPYCSADQNRPAPTSEAGKALRSLYDRYGAIAVLSNSTYMSSGIGDLMDDSKKLRNQLKMAMDAGVGRLYLEQLSTGKPDADFDLRVKRLLTEEAGMNDSAARELAGYFDEMIGWHGAKKAPKKTESAAEIDRSGKCKKPETTGAQKQTADEKPRDGISPEPLPSTPVPKSAGSTWGCVLCPVMFFGSALLAVFVSPAFSIGIILAVVAFFVIPFIPSKKPSVDQLTLARDGSAVICSWSGTLSVDRWLLAVNGQWIAAGVSSPFRLPDVPPNAEIILAYQKGSTPIYAGQGKA